MHKVGAAGVAILCAAIGAVSQAGVVSPTGADASLRQVESVNDVKRLPGGKELPTSLDASQRNRADSVIQCWQDGRLIFDERNWQLAGKGIGGPVLQSSAGRYAKLRLLQFDDTFCALKYGAR